METQWKMHIKHLKILNNYVIIKLVKIIYQDYYKNTLTVYEDDTAQVCEHPRHWPVCRP